MLRKKFNKCFFCKTPLVRVFTVFKKAKIFKVPGGNGKQFSCGTQPPCQVYLFRLLGVKRIKNNFTFYIRRYFLQPNTTISSKNSKRNVTISFLIFLSTISSLFKHHDKSLIKSVLLPLSSFFRCRLYNNDVKTNYNL